MSGARRQGRRPRALLLRRSLSDRAKADSLTLAEPERVGRREVGMLSKIGVWSAVLGLAGCATAPLPAPVRYAVSYDLEYGYVFETGTDRFFPEIAPDQRARFDDFFSEAHLATLVGKRLCCDCVVTPSGPGRPPRVVRAALYAL